MADALKTIITLDYELYFGENAGTVQRCLIDPTDALLMTAKRAGFKLVFFVDAGFIFRLQQQRHMTAEVDRQYSAVSRQLQHIVRDGHDIQLHVHPHWEDSHWHNGSWRMDTRRYRIHSFSKCDAHDIVTKYRHALSEASGYTEIVAYRAGGFAMQPFEHIAGALRDNKILIDSSVLPGLFHGAADYGYDFRDAPQQGTWRFSDDPTIEVPLGEFLEIPISSVVATPLTKLGSAVSKRFGPELHAIYGDGYAVGARSLRNSLGRFRRLFEQGPTPVTLDGFKSILIEKAYQAHFAAKAETFVVIGHPKAITPFALDRLAAFFQTCKPASFTYPMVTCALSGLRVGRVDSSRTTART